MKGANAGKVRPGLSYTMERARSTTSRRLADELGALSGDGSFCRTLGWARDDLTRSNYISGTPEDRYRTAISLAAAIFRPLAARMKLTFSTIRFTCCTSPAEFLEVPALGRCLLWNWSSTGKVMSKLGASRWYDAHCQVQCVRVDKSLKHRFEGVLYSAVGYCWDDDLHTDAEAKAALRRDGFMTEA
jgi:hypothetical protein